MEEATYCKDVCGAKCCEHHQTGIKCPQLAPDNSCSCYDERFAPHQPDLMYVGLVQINESHVINFNCSRIMRLLEQRALPQDVVDQCCIAHPELLEAI